MHTLSLYMNVSCITRIVAYNENVTGISHRRFNMPRAILYTN